MPLCENPYCALAPNILLLSQAISSRRRLRPSTARAAVSDAAEGPMNEGNPALQENLVRMVRLQIGQEKVKESAEVERQKLQEIADQVITNKWLPTCAHHS